MLSLPRPIRIAAPRNTLIVPTIALALALAACETIVPFVPDQPPTVTLTSGPIDTVSAPQSWLVDIAWTASDPDGHVDHFEYAIDPPPLKRARLALAETSWVTTHESHVVARFRASHPDSLVPGATASEFHVFVLRAVDNRGGMSPNVVRAFYAYTVAPDVQITRPIPNQLLAMTVPLPFRVDWHGHDPDGEGAGDPVGYRYRVVNLTDYANDAYLADPDSLLREGEASGWAGWTSVPGESASAVVTEADVPAYGNGLFALTAVDAAGATTPYMLFDRNALFFHSMPPGTTGPLIHIFNALVDFTYQSGGWSVDPLREIPIQTGHETALDVHWDAIAQIGRTVVASRWMIDGDPTGQTPRSGPDDHAHWSDWGPPAGAVTVPPLPPGTHRLYIEEKDDFDEKSLAIVRIESIAANATADLLVVNDTRLEVDKIPIGAPSPNPYTQPWPSAAELDTFLFARGGVPWRGTKNPTSGVLSPPGLLAGYAFDTLGTRLGLENPAAGVPLSTLTRYRHVLWIVDPRGAGFGSSLNQGLFPTTALRAMSGPGLISTLAAYIQMGGKVWLAGGGGAYASLANWDLRSNNVGGNVFTVADGELGPSRPLYDAAHVRSALTVVLSDAEPVRSPAARGGWTGGGPDGTLNAPDYAHAPAALHRRTPDADPLPPTRLASQASQYYPTVGANEFVSAPNEITEGGTPALDTLYEVTSGSAGIDHAPAMLYYHGHDNTPFVFTGFDLWSWSHADCQGLVDFVLGDVWGLGKSPPGANAARSTTSTERAQRPAPSRASARLDPRIMRP